MNYKFAHRIQASLEPQGEEVDAVTYKQFMEWEQKDKDQYLKDHPKSSFRHKIKKEPGYQKPAANPKIERGPQGLSKEQRRRDADASENLREEMRKDRKKEGPGPVEHDYGSTDALKRMGNVGRRAGERANLKRLRGLKSMDEMIDNQPKGPRAAYWSLASGGLVGSQLNHEQHSKIKEATEKAHNAFREWKRAEADREDSDTTLDLKEQFEQDAAEIGDLFSQFTGSKKARTQPATALLNMGNGASNATPKP